MDRRPGTNEGRGGLSSSVASLTRALRSRGGSSRDDRDMWARRTAQSRPPKRHAHEMTAAMVVHGGSVFDRCLTSDTAGGSVAIESVVA
jgi:hypothetical protein